jgi:transcriptional regulator with XRE-family HTH domain
MSIISQNLKYLRRLNGLTQEQLARHLGIKRPSVGAYEEARAHPPYDVLTSLSKKFGVTVDQLIKTDLRRVRETPDLGLLGGATPAPTAPPVVSAPPRPLTEPEAPKPIATVIEKYYRAPSQMPIVAQRITLKRFSLRDGLRSELPASRPVVPEPPAPTPPAVSAAVSLVRRSQAEEYLHRYQQPEYLRELSTFTLPALPTGTYRAFEVGDDFPFDGALLVGSLVRNAVDVEDGKSYILVLRHQGIVFRRAYNQVKFKGTLLLSADHTPKPSLEVALKDVLEIWEWKVFVSIQLPDPGLSIERVRNLVQDLTLELDRLKR